MAADAVEVNDAGGALAWYAPGEASRGFCRLCGSPMFFKSPKYAGELHIARALFHQPLEQSPTANAFFSTRAPWGEHVERLRAEPEPAWSRPV